MAKPGRPSPTDYFYQMHTAAKAPMDRITATVHQYSIQHLHRKEHMMPGHEPDWFTSWAGDRHDGDDPEESEMHRLLVDQARDRSYPNEKQWAATRTLLKIETSSVEAVEVAPIWEDSDG